MARKIPKVGEVVYLNLNRDRALSSHRFLCSQLVKSMREGINRGCDFPSASLWYSVSENLFYINEGTHRARAHLFENALLAGKVEVIVSPKRGFVSLERASLIDIDVGNLYLAAYNKRRLEESLSHLPLDVSRRFCKENNLDPSRYLSQ